MQHICSYTVFGMHAIGYIVYNHWKIKIKYLKQGKKQFFKGISNLYHKGKCKGTEK
jgi:hypothetical protein